MQQHNVNTHTQTSNKKTHQTHTQMYKIMYLHFKLPSNTRKTKSTDSSPKCFGATGCRLPPSPTAPAPALLITKTSFPKTCVAPSAAMKPKPCAEAPKNGRARREALAPGLRPAEKPTRNYCNSTHHSPKTEKRQKYQVFSSLFPPKRACPKTNQELRVSYPNIKCE